jgi:hypothetical protein
MGLRQTPAEVTADRASTQDQDPHIHLLLLPAARLTAGRDADLQGDTVSAIGEEKAFNPRLRVRSVKEYVDLMNNPNLPNPKWAIRRLEENILAAGLSSVCHLQSALDAWKHRFLGLK